MVAPRIPRMIGIGLRNRAAKIMARSWVLSPISPTATTAVEVRRGSKLTHLVSGPGVEHDDAATSAGAKPEVRVVGLANRAAGQARRPRHAPTTAGASLLTRTSLEVRTATPRRRPASSRGARGRQMKK